jgi:hypothetical protein
MVVKNLFSAIECTFYAKGGGFPLKAEPAIVPSTGTVFGSFGSKLPEVRTGIRN